VADAKDKLVRVHAVVGGSEVVLEESKISGGGKLGIHNTILLSI
jgi:hypothetical protein